MKTRVVSLFLRRVASFGCLFGVCVCVWQITSFFEYRTQQDTPTAKQASGHIGVHPEHRVRV